VEQDGVAEALAVVVPPGPHLDPLLAFIDSAAVFVALSITALRMPSRCVRTIRAAHTIGSSLLREARATAGTPPEGFPTPGPFRMLFAGNMGKAQSLDAVIQAARLLQDRDDAVQMISLGRGLKVERLRRLASDLRLTNVTFLPPVPMSRVGAYLAAADALLVNLHRDPLFEITIPPTT